jgi:hypothetical protein
MIKDTSPVKKVKVVGKTQRRLSAKAFAAALGAKVVPGSRRAPRTVIGLMALREQAMLLVRATGGRPGLFGVERRQKIPVLSGDWERVEGLTEALNREKPKGMKGIVEAPRLTAGQVASLLLHQAIGAAVAAGSEPRKGSPVLVKLPKGGEKGRGPAR